MIEVDINALVKEFMNEYLTKCAEVELPVANQWVDDVLLPHMTQDMDSEVLQAFLEAVKVPVSAHLQANMNAADIAVQEVSEDVEETTELVD